MALVQPPAELSTPSAAGVPTTPIHAFGLTAEGGLFVVALEPSSDPSASGAVKASATHALAAYGAKAARMTPTLDRTHVVGVDTSGTKLLVHAVGSASLDAHDLPSLPKGETASVCPNAALPGLVVLGTSSGGSILLRLPPAPVVARGKPTASTPALMRAVSDDAPHVWGITASRDGKAMLALATLRPAAGSVISSLALEALPIEADGARVSMHPPASGSPKPRTRLARCAPRSTTTL